MIYFVVGLPGPITQWCNAALHGLIALTADRVAHLSFPALNTLPSCYGDPRAIDEAPLVLLRSHADHLILTALEPSDRLTDVLRQSQSQFLLPLEDPRDVVAGLCAEGHQAQAAVRAVANCCPFLLEYAVMPGAFPVRARDLADGGLSLLTALAAHLSLVANEEALVLLATQLPLPRETTWHSVMPDRITRLIEGALGAYANSFAGAELGDIEWHRELFHLGTDANRPPMAPIPLRDVGNGLCLVYGPYLRVPPGYWLARVVLGVSPEAAGQTFSINVFCENVLAATKFSPRNGGVFTVELDFVCDEVSGRAVETIITVGRNSAPGELAFGHVVIHPITLRQSVHDRWQDIDFRKVLDL